MDLSHKYVEGMEKKNLPCTNMEFSRIRSGRERVEVRRGNGGNREGEIE